MSERRRSEPRRQHRDRRVADRRLDARESVETSIRFLRAGRSKNKILSGDLVDVSLSGIRVLLETPLEQGDRILAEVRGENGDCFNLAAEAVWIEYQPDRKCLVGCMLSVELTDKQFGRMQRLATHATAV